jgi:hypothetical protein
MHTFTLQRMAETALSTWGEWRAESGDVICHILERGTGNPAHRRIPSGIYALATKPMWASHFDGAFKKMIGDGYKGILWVSSVPGRANIEIHTANLVQQLEGCLATGEAIVRDDHNDFAIEGGTSKPAYAALYPLVLAAMADGGAQLSIIDIPQP